MKLTTKLIKKLIAEEMEQMSIPFSAEKKPTDPTHHDPEKKPTDPTDDPKDSIDSAGTLKKAVRALTQSRKPFEGISSDEAKLIYNLLKDMLVMAQEENATRIFQKLEDLLGQGYKK